MKPYVLLTYSAKTKERKTQDFDLKSEAIRKAADLTLHGEITSWQLQKWSGPYQSRPNEFYAAALPVAQSPTWGEEP